MYNYAFNAKLPLWSLQFKSSSKVELISRKEIETQIIDKAFKEKGFRAKLIKDPNAEIQTHFDLVLPENMSIGILQESEDLVYLVIPHNPYAGIDESEIQATLGMGLDDIASWIVDSFDKSGYRLPDGVQYILGPGLDQQKELMREDRNTHAQLIAKAWRNEAFKKLLLADPILVLEDMMGEKMETKVRIEVLEETADKIFIILPHHMEKVLIPMEAKSYFTNRPILVVGTTVPETGGACFACISF